MLPLVVLVELAVLLCLFAAAAFFSMSETAFIGVRRLDVRRKAEAGDKRAQRVDKMLDDPERILSTVLVGNTIVNIASAGLATHIAEQLLVSWATLTATILVTIVVLIACELVPKTLAVQNPLRFAIRLARPLHVVESIMKPVIATAGAVTRGIVRLFGLKPARKASYITAEEIEMLVRVGVEQGEVDRFEQKVIQEVFDFTETPVSSIMTPAAKVHFLPRDATLAEATRVAAKEKRTRILVADGDFDHVLGFVHIKDLLHYTDQELERLPVTLSLRTTMSAPHDLMASSLLTQMQREHRSVAVVTDAHGHNIGILTADDLVEELVGEIHDEFDAARHGHTHTKGTWSVARKLH